ncbi:hypothetical protein LHK_02371 [Laribacter hongkongensis HLHK9]|uniref:Uncharacterized protein n=1 Tax=Laribacter hongkongensis (strain HLHK9) TaxID=557598 RepID=C1DB14_LARHH|nr:hypothetical protein LHK_02371 [Laribacter hongkongensis HLHK9]
MPTPPGKPTCPKVWTNLAGTSRCRAVWSRKSATSWHSCASWTPVHARPGRKSPSNGIAGAAYLPRTRFLAAMRHAAHPAPAENLDASPCPTLHLVTRPRNPDAGINRFGARPAGQSAAGRPNGAPDSKPAGPGLLKDRRRLSATNRT